MCERCETLIYEVMDDTGHSEAEVVSALWEFTAFPLSDYETSAAQLRCWAAPRLWQGDQA